MATTDIAHVTLVDAGTGNPHYLIFQEGREPWVGTIRDIMEDTEIDVDFDFETPIYLVTTGQQLARIHVECLDQDPDWLDWEITLAGDGGLNGELVESVTLDGGDNGWENARRTIRVNGF